MSKLAQRLALMILVAGALVARPAGARAASGLDIGQVHATYHGGALMPHPKVSVLFWGASWSTSPLPAYFDNFFKTLFADGRYMGNLAQYSAGSFTVGNGEFAGSTTDTVSPPKRVSDARIQAEFRAQIAAGHLPKPDADTLYYVFTPPNVVVVDSQGGDSQHDFLGYHEFAAEGQFAYAVIPYHAINNDPHLMTIPASHELAEAVTDPQPELQETGEGGWYDDANGEIGDIPATLFNDNQIDTNAFIDTLTDAGGARYAVQTEWSNQDQAPVAFAPASGS